MTPATLLLRQIHPSFVQQGRVTSQAFCPFPKDDGLLSVDNGDDIRPDSAWQRFVANPACASVGVQAVAHAECAGEGLPVIEDGAPHPEHCSIDFQNLDPKSVGKKAKALRSFAADRGWLFQAPSK